MPKLYLNRLGMSRTKKELLLRLYLSSFRMGDAFETLLAMIGPEAKVAIISNAVDFIPVVEREAYVRAVFDPAAVFTDQGLAAFDLDLRDYFARPDALDLVLADVSLVWAVGGNSFLLRRAFAQSGLDQILKRRLAEDSLVYGGWSAGAVVAGSTLRGIELMDQPDVVVAGYDPEPVWDGLGLVDYAIIPHFASDHPESADAARCAAYCSESGIAFRTLRDGEVIIIGAKLSCSDQTVP